jgi:hypothetical protein
MGTPGKAGLCLKASVDAPTRLTKHEAAHGNTSHFSGTIIQQEQICCQDFGNVFCITE